MNAFFRFIASPAGRVIRIVAGVALLVIGLWLVQDFAGWILAIVGLVPLLAGIFDRCVLAPLFSLPFDGPGLQSTLSESKQS